jgi:ribosome-associated toxin RatA of RatAB toxin-antitoxin module
MRLEDSVLVRCPTGRLYDMVKDVERHADLLPGYLESRILERKEGSCLVQREAIVDGHKRRWKSEVWFEGNRRIHFRQVEGPLAGMHVQWVLEPQNEVTRMSIIHDLRVKPRWKGWWFERWIARPAIERTARSVLEAIKTVAEKKALS